MRAAYSSGVLASFHDAGLRFDAVYGTSVGGALGAWWTAGQVREGLRTWDYVRDARIMSYGRWLTFRGPLLDHDALFKIVYERDIPLDVKAVQASPWPVVVTVTEVDSAKVRYVDLRKGRVIDWLRATGRLPLAAGKAVDIDGVTYIDGGFADPIPLQKAIDDGHKEIVALLNNPVGPRRPESRIATWLVSRRFPALADLARRHHAIHDDAVELAERPPKGVAVHIIRPLRSTGLHRLSRNAAKLSAGIEQGRAEGAAFVREHPELRTRAPSAPGRPRSHL